MSRWNYKPGERDSLIYALSVAITRLTEEEKAAGYTFASGRLAVMKDLLSEIEADR